MRIDEARLYLVVDARPDVVEAALRGGVDIVQLRVKDTPDHELIEAARAFRQLCSAHGALFVVNDSPELAATAEADGLHLGQEDMPIAEARRIFSGLVGRSTHTAEQIAAAADADYIAVGPVFATPTKPGRPPVGLELVREAARAARPPWFAIGGIDATNLGHVLAAGATRVAVVRAITDATNPDQAARTIRAHLHEKA